MGILRADRVSGLGGANAINGSVFFGTSDLQSNNQNLIVSNTSELDIGSGNFTIEYWFNCGDTSTDGFNAAVATTEYTNTSSNTAFNIYHYNKGFRIYNRASSSFPLIFTNDNSWTPSTWHHFAWVREGTGSSENKVYIDGSHIGSAFTNAADYTTGQDWLIGANFYGNGYGQPEYGFSGYLSNVRVSNVARYTVNFTAPTTRYEKDANTIILACQSPSNILKEETGKTLTPCTKDVNTAFPVASHIAPDVGEDHGTTFTDNTKFDTLSYMVPPGGRTDQRGRGRGMFISQVGSGNWSNAISYIQIQTLGVVQDFGDLIYPRRHSAGTSSATRGVIGAGIGPSWPANKTTEYSTLATTGNATSFGELLDEKYGHAAFANSTRGIFTGGYSPSPVGGNVNVMEYITFATTGNSLDFGDQTDGSSVANRYVGSGISNGTRGTIQGGYTGGGYVNTIIYVPNISSLSNTSDFGNLSNNLAGVAGCSDTTRGIFFGGYNPANINTIEYITIATTGNAQDFGDLTGGAGYSAAVSNSIRGVVTLTNGNRIDYVTIQTTGNAQDFGDLNTAGGSYGANANFSDSHGGI